MQTEGTSQVKFGFYWLFCFL